MHNVAGAFVGGAGLFVLLPILVKDTIILYLTTFLHQLDSKAPWPTMAWVVPITIAALLPLVGTMLMIKQVLCLYFVPHRGSTSIFVPRFALSAITLPTDGPHADAPSRLKEGVLDAMYDTSMIMSVVPFSRRQVRKAILTSPKAEIATIVPELRRKQQNKILKSKDEQWNDDQREEYAFYSNAFNALSGFSGVVDRTLIQQCAKLEDSLIRFNIGLRILMIKYTQSLLIGLWVSLVLIVGASLIEPNPSGSHIPNSKINGTELDLVLLIVGLLCCSLGPYFAALPARWIRETANPAADVISRDPHIWKFDVLIFGLSSFGWLAGLVGVVARYWGDIPPGWTWVTWIACGLVLGDHLRKIWSGLRRDPGDFSTPMT